MFEFNSREETYVSLFTFFLNGLNVHDSVLHAYCYKEWSVRDNFFHYIVRIQEIRYKFSSEIAA